MPFPNNRQKITIWLWPAGLFPRRVIFYLRAKGITATTLQSHNIHIIPVTYGPSVLVTMPGYETRPVNTSVPCLRIEKGNGDMFWIHESLAILEYFEDLFSEEKGFISLRGKGFEQKARTRDIVGLTTEAMFWSLIDMTHSNVSTTKWSGLKEEQMRPDIAEHGKKYYHSVLKKVEKWVEPDVVGNRTKSLTGAGADVTFADIVLLAQVDYLQRSYGSDWLEGHEVLKIWFERAKGQSWYVGEEALGGADGSDSWEGLFGK